MVWSLKTLLFTLQIANSQPRGVRPHVRTFPLWMLKRGWYIFIFLDGCALFPQYCRWTKTAASRQVNMEVPESAVCSRQGLQQFITERQYKARPVWLQLVNYNKSLGVFSFILGYRGQGGLAFHKHSALCYTAACFHTLRAFCLAHTSTDRYLASKVYSKRSVDTKCIL